MPSDISSAGIARVTSGCDSTSRKDVLRRVQVPAVPGATTRTRPVPGSELEFGEHMSARRTRLAGRVPAINHHERAARSGALVRQLPSELAPTRIGDGSGERPVAGSGNLGLRQTAVVASTLATSKSTLVASEVSSLAVQMARIADPMAVAGHQEIPQTEVKAHRVSSCQGWRSSFGVDRERHVPAVVRITGDHDHGRVDLGHVGVKRPAEPQRRAVLGKNKNSIAHAEHRAGVVSALPTSAGLEPRTVGSASEEVCTPFARHTTYRESSDE